jgi:hypothetical protein
VAFVLFVPISLIYPIFIQKYEHDTPLTRHPLSTTATLHTLWWAAVATALLCRLLYRRAGGGEGDDARHFDYTHTGGSHFGRCVHLPSVYIVLGMSQRTVGCPHTSLVHSQRRLLVSTMEMSDTTSRSRIRIPTSILSSFGEYCVGYIVTVTPTRKFLSSFDCNIGNGRY